MNLPVSKWNIRFASTGPDALVRSVRSLSVRRCNKSNEQFGNNKKVSAVLLNSNNTGDAIETYDHPWLDRGPVDQSARRLRRRFRFRFFRQQNASHHGRLLWEDR